MHVRVRVLLASIVVGGAVLGVVEQSQATLENQVFTSRSHRVRLGVPRGWRASDQSSYPGILLWMRRSKPPGMMLLTSEAIDDEIYCAWPPQCRQQSDVLAAQYACALAARLEQLAFRVGPIQAGPRDGTLPSVWFEYDDGRRWLRQAVASDDIMAHTLILSAGSAQQRANHARSFDQALRSLHALAEDEIDPPPEPTAMPAGGADANPGAAGATAGGADANPGAAGATAGGADASPSTSPPPGRGSAAQAPAPTGPALDPIAARGRLTRKCPGPK